MHWAHSLLFSQRCSVYGVKRDAHGLPLRTGEWRDISRGVITNLIFKTVHCESIQPHTPTHPPHPVPAQASLLSSISPPPTLRPYQTPSPDGCWTKASYLSWNICYARAAEHWECCCRVQQHDGIACPAECCGVGFSATTNSVNQLKFHAVDVIAGVGGWAGRRGLHPTTGGLSGMPPFKPRLEIRRPWSRSIWMVQLLHELMSWTSNGADSLNKVETK